ncbi:MAG: glycosyltransferase family 4 protein [Rickettsiales bacterium]|nr:glycosyltransferase family 4 protein [Rickettsiales bacterium]
MKKNKLTIMQVLPALYQGGVERGTIDLAKFLDKKGHNSVVVSKGGLMTKEFEGTGVTHINLDVRSKNPVKMLINSFKLRKLIKENNADIIHARSRIPAWTAYWAKKGTKAKFITTFHGAGKLPKNPVLKFFKRYYNSIMCTSIPTIAPSQNTFDFIVKNYHVNPCNIKVIYRWVDLEKYNENLNKEKLNYYKNLFRIPANSKVIIATSRLARIKGHDVLIKALAQVKSDFYLVLVGEAKNKKFLEEIKALIKEYKLEQKVLFAGLQIEMEYIYPLAYLTTNVSTVEETFGRTIVESLASGVPCIATNIGGPLEIIQDGVSGFFVEPNDIEGLAKKIDYVLNLPSKDYEKLQKNCKKRAEFFSLKAKCQETLDVYEQLLSKKGWMPEC